MFPYDFRDDRMMKQLKEITQRIISIYPELQADVASLTHNLINKVNKFCRASLNQVFSIKSLAEIYFLATKTMWCETLIH